MKDEKNSTNLEKIVTDATITIDKRMNENVKDALLEIEGACLDLEANKVSKINITAGSVGSSSETLVLTINAQGQVTVFSAVAISITTSQISDAGTAGGCAVLNGTGKLPSTYLPDGVANQIGTYTPGTEGAPSEPPVDAPTRPGDFYVIAAAGVININNTNVTVNTGDHLYFNGTSWAITASVDISMKVDKIDLEGGDVGSESQTLLLTINAQGQVIDFIAIPISITTSQISDAGTAGGCAVLNGTGKLPSTYLPDGVANQIGTYKPGTNTTPSSVPTDTPTRPGDYYLVTETGVINIGGMNYNVSAGDHLYFNGTSWAITASVDISIKVDKINIVGGSVGSSSETLVLTINAQGQVTVFSAVAISITTSQISDAGTAGGCAVLNGTGKLPSTYLPDGVANQIGTYTPGTEGAPSEPPVDAPTRPGDFYVIAAAGVININNTNVTVNTGDHLYFNGTSWAITASIDISMKVDKIDLEGGDVGSESQTLLLTINAQGQVIDFIAIPISITTSQISDAGTAGGCAVLNGTGKLPSTYLPDGVANQIGTYTPGTEGAPSEPPVDAPTRPGDFYVIAAAGVININNTNVTVNTGDHLYFNGTSWAVTASVDISLKVDKIDIEGGDIGFESQTLLLTINAQGQVIHFDAIPISITTSQISDAGTAGGCAVLGGTGKLPTSYFPNGLEIQVGVLSGSTDSGNATAEPGTATTRPDDYYLIIASGFVTLNSTLVYVNIGEKIKYNSTTLQWYITPSTGAPKMVFLTDVTSILSTHYRVMIKNTTGSSNVSLPTGSSAIDGIIYDITYDQTSGTSGSNLVLTAGTSTIDGSTTFSLSRGGSVQVAWCERDAQWRVIR